MLTHDSFFKDGCTTPPDVKSVRMSLAPEPPVADATLWLMSRLHGVKILPRSNLRVHPPLHEAKASSFSHRARISRSAGLDSGRSWSLRAFEPFHLALASCPGRDARSPPQEYMPTWGTVSQVVDKINSSRTMVVKRGHIQR